MEERSDIQRFEELELQADTELGAVGEMVGSLAAFYADEVLGDIDPAFYVAEIARKAERAYILRRELVPPHVAAAAMEEQSDSQCFDELELQADAELGAVGEMSGSVAAYYADEILGDIDPVSYVAEIARKAKKAYISRGEAVPQHVGAAAMEEGSDRQRFEELERLADSELGAIGEMSFRTAMFYADEVLGDIDPAFYVAEIARKAERAYISRGEVVPPHVSAATTLLKPGLLDVSMSAGAVHSQSDAAHGRMLPNEDRPDLQFEPIISADDKVLAFSSNKHRDSTPPPEGAGSETICHGQLALKLHDIPSSQNAGGRATSSNLKNKGTVCPRQTALFFLDCDDNVLPFSPIPDQPTLAKHEIKKQALVGVTDLDTQGWLDLDILPPASQTPRTLKSTVEASIYCDAPVAAPMHRCVATFLDAAMILIGCGVFLGIFHCFGGSVHFDKFDAMLLLCSLVLIAMFYGLLFALAGRETAGQNWTELRLVNFDGFPPDSPSRALRFASGWLSFWAFGIGLVWALMDEENLTWHDHMSKTFLTPRGSRERPR